MATINVSKHHTLGRERARKAIDDVARDMKGRIGVDYQWSGDELTFERSGVDGTISVQDDVVNVQVKLGLFAAPMQGMVQREIENYLDRYLK